MNPTKFFWNTVAVCIAAITFFFCLLMYRSQEVQVSNSNWELKLWTVKAETLVNNLETTANVVAPQPSTQPSTPNPIEPTPKIMPIKPAVDQLKDNLRDIQQSIQQKN